MTRFQTDKILTLKGSELIKKRIQAASATPFQKKVWEAILAIPKGEVRTYAWVARQIGRPKAVRAVGNALNKNPFAPEVPCHRVIRSDGTIGGFANGTKRKFILLRREGFGTCRFGKVLSAYSGRRQKLLLAPPKPTK